MERILRQLFSIVVTAFILMGFSGTEGWAASGSSQSKSDGKLECMEFTGTLPAGLKTVCTLGGGQNTKWVDSPCPRDSVQPYSKL